jgi:hypothetical protein
MEAMYFYGMAGRERAEGENMKNMAREEIENEISMSK